MPASRYTSHIVGPLIFSLTGRHAMQFTEWRPPSSATPAAPPTSKTSRPRSRLTWGSGWRPSASAPTTASPAPTAPAPGLDQALAAVRKGDTLVVPKLDRLARSVPDARAIGDDLAKRGVKLQIGGSIHDPNDPMGKLFFNILATFAEFEADLIRMRTREGMAMARAKGQLKGRRPKLSTRQQELRPMYGTGAYSVSDLAELFSISRPTVYRTLERQTSATP